MFFFVLLLKVQMFQRDKREFIDLDSSKNIWHTHDSIQPQNYLIEQLWLVTCKSWAKHSYHSTFIFSSPSFCVSSHSWDRKHGRSGSAAGSAHWVTVDCITSPDLLMITGCAPVCLSLSCVLVLGPGMSVWDCKWQVCGVDAADCE